MQSELKPCPFCGGEAVMQEPHWRDGTLCGEAPFCRVCGIKTPRYWPKRTGTAIAAWNARASDAEITRLTEALRAAEEREQALREALAWYGEKAAGCRRITREGDDARYALDRDRGERARQALAGAKP